MSKWKPIEEPVYVTKYALSHGVRVYTQGDTDGHYFNPPHAMVVNSDHWTYDREESVRRVTEMAEKKLKSLDKQRATICKIIAQGAQYKDAP